MIYINMVVFASSPVNSTDFTGENEEHSLKYNSVNTNALSCIRAGRLHYFF